MQFIPEALAVSIITITVTAIAAYIFAIPRIGRQLEANLQQESEKIRQQFQADLQKEFTSRFNERKWETYEHFADIIRRLMERVSNNRLRQRQAKIIQELSGFKGEN